MRSPVGTPCRELLLPAIPLEGSPGSTLLASLCGCALAGPHVSTAGQGSVWLLGTAAPP